jgi:GT2 family glycosyltransferase
MDTDLHMEFNRKGVISNVDYEARAAALTFSMYSGLLGRIIRLSRKINAKLGGVDHPIYMPTKVRRIINKSGLFQHEWYRSHYPDIAESGIEPLTHYITEGFSEGRMPNPLFDTRYYLSSNPDVRKTGVNPLYHYITAGEKEGRRPNPFFDPLWYLSNNIVSNKAAFALKHYLDAKESPNLIPSREFNADQYFEVNIDLPRTIPALSHYLILGAREGRFRSLRHAAMGHGVGHDGLPNFTFDALPGTRASAGYRLTYDAVGYVYLPPSKPPLYPPGNHCSKIRFSIITPVFNVEPRFLQALITSVIDQWHNNWELILVDDASSNADTRSFLESLQDSRIQIVFRSENGGIAAATNEALNLATGLYVVFLDHDDELTLDCLYELARRISETDADYIYSDEDKIDEYGHFFMPFFKPDWSPDAFMSTMYTCHVSCVKTSLIRKIGGVRLGFDGAQDYDLILRLTEICERIEHIPKVLYHWRALPSSIAADISAKPSAIDAVRNCKIDALERRGLSGELEPILQMPGQFRVKYNVKGTPLISIIIPSRDNVKLLKKCIKSIKELSKFYNYEIIIIDNGSKSAETISYLNTILEMQNLDIISVDKPFNYSELNNIGARRSKGDILIFLNDDTEVISEDWLERMAGYSQLSHIGAVGAKLIYPNGKIQHCGIVNLLEGPGHAFLSEETDKPLEFGRNILEYNWLAVTGACMMIERSKFDEIDGFDESFPVSYNDVELCFRLHKAGYYNVVCQSARLIHYESASRGADLSPEKAKRLAYEKQRLYRLHPELFAHDPFHNPNLHPSSVYFEL